MTQIIMTLDDGDNSKGNDTDGKCGNFTRNSAGKNPPLNFSPAIMSET